MKKSIFLKVITIALALVLFTCVLTSCLEPDYYDDDCYNDHYYEKHHHITKQEIKNLLEVSAKEYAETDLTDEKITLSEAILSVKPFFSVNQDTFTKLFVKKDLSKNNAILTSKEIFRRAAVSAYTIVSKYDNFKVNKVYDATVIDQSENPLDVEIYPVGIIDDKDGGIYLLYFEDSVVENTTTQAIFHITLKKNKAIVESTIIYAGSGENNDGIVIADHIHSVSNENIEFASAKFTFDDAETARRVSKVMMSESSIIKELKEHLIFVEYEYAVYVDGQWESNGINVDLKENKLNEDTLKLYKVLINEISEFNADFSVIFNDDIKEISIVIPVETKIPVESTDSSELVESAPADGLIEESIATESSSESN